MRRPQDLMKLFPVHATGPLRVPWDLLIDHEAQALKNHGQTLERLAMRGGLSVSELVAVLETRDWRSMTDAEANKRFYALLADHWGIR